MYAYTHIHTYMLHIRIYDTYVLCHSGTHLGYRSYHSSFMLTYLYLLALGKHGCGQILAKVGTIAHVRESGYSYFS